MQKSMKKRFSALNILWIVPLVLAAVFIIMMYLVPAFDTVDKAAVDGSGDWMARLPDETLLSEVILPGTHDSATQNVQLAFFSKCQDMGIGEQLESGFRYLDIRLGADGNRLKLMHGFTNCTTGGWPWSGALYLDSVLNDCYSFLNAHPTETVVFAVKEEHGDESFEEFHALLASYISQNADMWLLSDSIPTVGEARGKLVLLKRYSAGDGLSFFWPSQSGKNSAIAAAVDVDNGSYTLHVQDRFEFGADDKWNAFIEGMIGGSEDIISLNFLSTKGTFVYGHPYKYAGVLNPRLLETPSDSLRGWIIVDFASPRLAEHIYSANFTE